MPFQKKPLLPPPLDDVDPDPNTLPPPLPKRGGAATSPVSLDPVPPSLPPRPNPLTPKKIQGPLSPPLPPRPGQRTPGKIQATARPQLPSAVPNKAELAQTKWIHTVRHLLSKIKNRHRELQDEEKNSKISKINTAVSEDSGHTYEEVNFDSNIRPPTPRKPQENKGKSTFYVEADLDEEICSDCESDDSGTGDDYEEVDFVPVVRPQTPRKPHKSKVERDGNNTGPDSSNSNKGTPPGRPPGKPPKPSTLPKPQLNQKAFSSPSKQAKKVAVAVPSNKPTFVNKPMAKVLPQPQKPSPDNPSALPRALPFKHPTQDNRSENSCPSSTSPDSGGSVQSAFVAELSNFISSSSKHLERLQVTVEDQQSTDSSLYVDGSSVREHPLSCHPWFHEDANRTMGDARVMQIRQEGAFLVRPSSKEHPYTLVVFSDKKVCNLPINLRTDGQYALGSEESEEKRFESVAALIKYHLHSKINLSHGDHVQLSKHAQRQ